MKIRGKHLVGEKLLTYVTKINEKIVATEASY